ncbi:bifunctional glutamate N-acetyltransferase/amino-acid acetyltransferase ArgJ [Desulforhopalus singaporensis]|uniref:Arginine biosynthesis bifunctional protein ArgJ n=1 Tax=Desulforhopalus singaporensis TaxID=91360 RepID=A0A1H0MRW3_9BACT|nr:bifunctional glutamate N-acetyltransferase/amino-acid acetyltransferase ArgJ [Desulforhopalus singaporensis]SDO83035.1 glutamate N-acetyltransferase [Desulforhopalus singaporensis]
MKGFTFSAVKAGVRYKDRLDVGLICSDTPCVTAGVFTTSQVKAAPVVIDQGRLANGTAQAILVNSGCANACTGDEGVEAALACSRLVAEQMKVDEENVLLSSTGVIGEQLNVRAFEDSIKELVSSLSADNFELVARAIMTTDTFPKVAAKTITIDGRPVEIRGMAKGAGMIMPNMATMLAFVFTDADISSAQLQQALSAANERTFNRITVDGDTSTNDMVVVMANGTARNRVIDGTGDEADCNAFSAGLEAVLKDLALQIVSDGEGATKTITISVRGANSDEDAEKLGRTVATSSLVKTAFFGEDANWGRILAAMGRAGVVFPPEKVDLSFGDVQLVKNGLGLGREAEEKATAVLKEKCFTIGIDLQDGDGGAELYTCDFSLDYVKINADYRS